VSLRYALSILMVLGAGLDLLAAGCRPSCTPKTLADIEARYSLAVMADCKGYGSLAECPAAPELKAQRRAAEEAASCR
jgi:hypothetical protein